MSWWLFKTEPHECSIWDLQRAYPGTIRWDGVRNYQARNYLRDQVLKTDRVFIYHSSIAEPGIVGIASVTSNSYPDPTALEQASPYFDQKSSKIGSSRWYSVDVRFEHLFNPMLSLKELKQISALDGFALLQRGQRLSIMPVGPDHAKVLTSLVGIAF